MSLALRIAMRSSAITTPVSITGWTRACLFSSRRCPADILVSPNDLVTCRLNASVEELRMIDLTRAPARFRAFPGDIRIALERGKPFSCKVNFQLGSVETAEIAPSYNDACP